MPVPKINPDVSGRVASSVRTVSATFHLTHACNLRCTYCYTGEKLAVHMSDEIARAGVELAVAEAQRQGARHLETVFFGGEPLLRAEQLLRICDLVRARARECASELRTSFKLSTNGLLLTETLMEHLSRAQVFVSLSADGAPDVQDAQRPDARGRGSSAQLVDAIAILLSFNPCANVTCVTTPESAGRLDASVQWLRAQGFAFITTTLDYSAAWTRKHLRELEASARRLADWYVAETLAGEKLYLSCFDKRIRSWTREPVSQGERCALGGRQFSIAPSGRLFPCVQFVHEDDDQTFAIGHVNSGFDAPARKEIACTTEGEKPECGGCALVERCSSWCACINYMSTGRIDRASPVLCEAERLLLPIADLAARRLWNRRNPTFLHKHYNPAYPVLEFLEHIVLEEKNHAS